MLCLPLLAVGRDEPLVRREPHQRQPERVRLAFDLLKRGVRLVLHLDVQDLDAVEAHRRGLVDAVGDVEPRAFAELPEGIRRDADGVWPPRSVSDSRAGILGGLALLRRSRSPFRGTAPTPT